MNAVIAVMPVMPRPTPNRAVSTGRPAATSEPKVRIRTRIATAMPISSDLPPSSGWAVVPEPLASTMSPSARASAIVSSSFSMVAGFTSATVFTSKSQVIVPTRPSSESGESAWALAFAAAASPPAFCAAWVICVCWAAAASTGLAGAGLVGSLPSGICGSAERSLTRRVDGRLVLRVGELLALRCGDDDLHRGLVERVGGPGEQLGLQRGGALRRDARDREGVAHRLGQRAGHACRHRSSRSARRRRRTASAGRRSCRGGRAAWPWRFLLGRMCAGRRRQVERLVQASS